MTTLEIDPARARNKDPSPRVERLVERVKTITVVMTERVLEDPYSKKLEEIAGSERYGVVLKGVREIQSAANDLLTKHAVKKGQRREDGEIVIELLTGIDAKSSVSLCLELLENTDINSETLATLAEKVDVSLAAGGVFVLEYDSNDRATASALVDTLKITDSNGKSAQDILRSVKGFTPDVSKGAAKVIFVDKSAAQVSLKHEIHEAVTSLIHQHINDIVADKAKIPTGVVKPIEIANTPTKIAEMSKAALMRGFVRDAYAEVIADLMTNPAEVQDGNVPGFYIRDIDLPEESLANEQLRETWTKVLDGYESGVLLVRALRRAVMVEVQSGREPKDIAGLLRIYLGKPEAALEYLNAQEYEHWKRTSTQIAADSPKETVTLRDQLTRIGCAYGIERNTVSSEVSGRFITAKPSLSEGKIITTTSAEKFLVISTGCKSGAWSATAMGVMLGPAQVTDNNGVLITDQPVLDAQGRPLDKGYRVKRTQTGVTEEVFYDGVVESPTLPLDAAMQKIFIKQLLVPHLQGKSAGGSDLITQYQMRMERLAEGAMVGMLDMESFFAGMVEEFELLRNQPPQDYVELRSAIRQVNAAVDRVNQAQGSDRAARMREFVTAVQDLVRNYIQPEVQKAEARALREFSTGIRVSATSEHFAKILGLATEESGAWYLIQELKGEISGEEHLSKSKGVDTGEAVVLLRDITEALVTLEANEDVHRDVKPANVRITLDGATGRITKAYLVDAGIVGKKGQLVEGGAANIAVLYDAETRQAGQSTTAPGSLRGTTKMGSFDYAPMEQLQGTTPLAFTMDIAGLGSTVFEMMTGETLMSIGVMHEQDESKRAQVIQNILTQQGFPTALINIVVKTLAYDPRDRYQDAKELYAEIRTQLLAPYDRYHVRDGFSPESLRTCRDELELAKELRRGLFPPNDTRTSTVKALVSDLLNAEGQDPAYMTQAIKLDLLDQAIRNYRQYADSGSLVKIRMFATASMGISMRLVTEDLPYVVMDNDPQNVAAGISWTAHMIEQLKRIHKNDAGQVMRGLRALVNLEHDIEVADSHAVLTQNEFLFSPVVSRSEKQELLRRTDTRGGYVVETSELLHIIRAGEKRTTRGTGDSRDRIRDTALRNSVKELGEVEAIRRLHEFAAAQGVQSMADFLEGHLDFGRHTDSAQLMEVFSGVVGGYINRDAVLSTNYFKSKLVMIRNVGSPGERSALVSELGQAMDLFYYRYARQLSGTISVQASTIIYDGDRLRSSKALAGGMRTVVDAMYDASLDENKYFQDSMQKLQEVIEGADIWNANISDTRAAFVGDADIVSLYESARGRFKQVLEKELVAMRARLTAHEILIPEETPEPTKVTNMGFETGESKSRRKAWSVREKLRISRLTKLDELIGIIRQKL